MHEAARLCERLTYKPGYRVEISRVLHDDNHLGIQPVYVRVFAMVTDVNDHSRQSPLYNSEGHPWYWFEQATEEQVVSLIRGQCRRLELHEVDEWLRLDGVCVTEPHPDLSHLGFKPVAQR